MKKLKLVKPIKRPEYGDYYVYILYDMDEKTPIYVGKGRNRRWLEHEKIALSGRDTHCNPRLYRWILKVIDKNGYLYKMKVLEGAKDEEAVLLEMALISQFGRADRNLGSLLNLTDGGYGVLAPVIRESTRCKLRKLPSPDVIERRRAGLLKYFELNPRPYKPHSKEHIENRRLALIGKKRTLEQRMNISNGLTGIEFSEQRKKNMSEAARKRWARLPTMQQMR